MKRNEIYEETEIPDGLETRLEVLIDRLAEAEIQSKKRTKKLRLQIGSIAASIAVLVSIGLYINRQNGLKDTLAAQNSQIEDAKIAYMEAQKALELVSRNFNIGLDQLTLVSNEIEKTNKILNETFKR